MYKTYLLPSLLGIFILSSCSTTQTTPPSLTSASSSSGTVISEKVSPIIPNETKDDLMLEEDTKVVEPAVAFISVKPLINPKREKDNAYRIYGETSNNCSKVEVTTESGDATDSYFLTKYVYGDTSFSYGIREDWDNLFFGENTYTFTAYCDGQQVKQTSATINNLTQSIVVATPTTSYIPSLSQSDHVAPVLIGSDVIETKIDGDFEGWDGETIFKLSNGTIWQQTSYNYTYHYAYRPDVLIYSKNGSHYMRVEGVDDVIRVSRLK